MDSEVDPSADALWASVGSTVTSAGTVDRSPHTDEEWKQVRRYAVTLAEAPNLLAAPGRLVILPGQKTDDATVKGIQGPAIIQDQIAADPARFARLARGLQDAGLKAVAAIDAKDSTALLEAGAAIDEACESCHRTYWYPNTPQPSVPAAPAAKP